MLTDKDNQPLELEQAINLAFGGNDIFDTLADGTTYGLRVTRKDPRTFTLHLNEGGSGWIPALEDAGISEVEANLRHLLEDIDGVELGAPESLPAAITSKLAGKAPSQELLAEVLTYMRATMVYAEELHRPVIYLALSVAMVVMALASLLGVPVWAIRKLLEAMAAKEGK